MINRFKIFFFIFLLSTSLSDLSKAANDDDIYKKIDLFSEVLDKINKEYVDEINQSEAMDAAINGVLQSLDPYSAYMSPAGDIYAEYGSKDCRTPLIAASIASL